MADNSLRAVILITCITSLVFSATLVGGLGGQPLFGVESGISGQGPEQGEQAGAASVGSGEEESQSSQSTGSASGEATGTSESSGEGSQPGQGQGRSSIATGRAMSQPRTTLGGPISELSTELVWEIDSPRPAYWRVDAYSQYTGSGWTREPETSPYDPPVRGGPGERVTQRVTPKYAADVLPAAWRPQRVGQRLADGASVTTTGGLVVEEPLDVNESYTVTSRIGRPEPATLRAAGTEYPAGVEDRYTTLPDSVPDRLTRRTAEITSDAETPYGTAVAIERWLESNKEYSLNASRPEGDFVTSFLFEMDAGYCQYFAASMAVMLRTQGVPARYVTGYTAGQPTDDGSYAVRGTNAHAWVEVYFPETGWVRFDPTPAAPRLSAERQQLARTNETGGTNTSAGQAGGTGGPGPSGESPPGQRAVGSPQDGRAGEETPDSEPTPTQQDSPGRNETRNGESTPAQQTTGNQQETQAGDGTSSGGSSGSSIATGTFRDQERTTVGGPIELSSEVVWVIESPRAAYWRVNGFGEYTGDGWARASETSPYDPPVREGDGARVTHRVTPRYPSTVLPAAWRPQTIDAALTDRAEVTTTGGVVLTEPLTVNQSYTVTSRVSRPSASDLRSTTGYYPNAIRERYTALPDSVPDRLETRTDDIVADAETPYGTAVAIERWLESNKEYSLNASRPEGDFATGFVFDLEEGYCEYFATSMVVMLRTQGIPARYVTGYTPGQPVGDGSYVVRGTNAHAWVEVYFPGSGWVRFDPTPADPRRQSERTSLRDARQSGQQNVDTRGSQDSTNQAETPEGPQERQQEQQGTQQQDQQDREDQQNRDGQDQQDREDQQESDAEPEPVSVELLDRPVPGTFVTVEVTRGDDPVAGARVEFNDEFVGETNATGMLRATVPYAETLRVRAVVGDQRAPASRLAVGGGPGTGVGPSLPLAPGGHQRGLDRSEENSTEYDLPTTIRIDPLSEPVIGGDLTLETTIEGTAVPGATVTVDGERVGRTNATGYVTITAPYAEEATVSVSRGDTEGNRTLSPAGELAVETSDPAIPGESLTVRATVAGTERAVGNATVTLAGESVGRTDVAGAYPTTMPYEETVAVTVTRGELSANTTVRADATLNVSIDGHQFPLSTVNVTATIAGDAVEGATISLDNETAATTGADGVAGVTLPVSNSVAVVVRKGGLTTSRSLTGLFVPVALGLALLVALASGALAARRYGPGERLVGWGHRAWALARRLPETALGLVVAGARLAADLIGRVAAAGRRIGAVLRELIRLIPRPAAFAARLRDVGRRLLSGLRTLPGRLGATVAAMRAETARPDGRTGLDATAAAVTESSTEDEAFDVRQAWAWFVQQVPVRNPEATTPGEYARRGIERGFSADAVRTLTRAFRETTYSRRDPDETLTQAARDAYRRLRGDGGEE